VVESWARGGERVHRNKETQEKQGGRQTSRKEAAEGPRRWGLEEREKRATTDMGTCWGDMSKLTTQFPR